MIRRKVDGRAPYSGNRISQKLQDEPHRLASRASYAPPFGYNDALLNLPSPYVFKSSVLSIKKRLAKQEFASRPKRMDSALRSDKQVVLGVCEK